MQLAKTYIALLGVLITDSNLGKQVFRYKVE